MSAAGGRSRATAQAAGLPHPGAGATDEQLATALAAGDEAAFEILYERHARGLRALCRRLLGSADDAEDALQQAMASVWWHLRQPETQTPVRVQPWLYTVTRNRCRSILGRRPPESSELLDVPGPLDLGEQVERRLELGALVRDLRDLPVEQRRALLLSELGGLSHADVADMLDRRESTIKSLVHQARARLNDWREARDLPCAEVRRQLLELRGGALRRRALRRHLQLCPSCRTFREARIRRSLLPFLPVLPAARRLAGLLSPDLSDMLAPAGSVAVAGVIAGGGLFTLGLPTPPPAPALTREAPALIASQPAWLIPAPAVPLTTHQVFAVFTLPPGPGVAPPLPAPPAGRIARLGPSVSTRVGEAGPKAGAITPITTAPAGAITASAVPAAPQRAHQTSSVHPHGPKAAPDQTRQPPAPRGRRSLHAAVSPAPGPSAHGTGQTRAHRSGPGTNSAGQAQAPPAAPQPPQPAPQPATAPQSPQLARGRSAERVPNLRTPVRGDVPQLPAVNSS